MDLYNRSQCRPRWVLRNLLVEFPHFSDSRFLPPCVSVLRCAGCCPDEALTCIPTQMQSITMQVIKTKSFKSELTEVSLIQHTRCQCRPSSNVTLKTQDRDKGIKKVKKKRRKGKKGRDVSPTPLAGKVCAPCNRRMSLNSVTCECVCHRSEKHCQQQGKKLNKELCRCEKLNS
ncbi:vascular endothelial growth factor B isoform X2 [Bombina bombina]|nr:vascular endothelial growth factor B isoform X2 [Bombina bombina]